MLSKRHIILIDNIFFIILYIFSGSLFFSLFYDDSFYLTINGNSGFVGSYIKDSYLVSKLNINQNITYYILSLFTFIIFLRSINFSIFKIFNLFKKTKIMSVLNNEKSKEDENIRSIETDLNEFSNENKKIQDTLPFENKIDKNFIKFYLPDLKFLKIPSKNEKIAKKNENIDEEFLEKVLLDFGVVGKIKKINYGPVVTLNEFEPAAGIKVSKIINLSEDIARNTSSESARISTIPGSSTIGIELPNTTRENVYLSEVIKDTQFKKRDIKLPIALGKSISGNPIIGDLSAMPHLLIAGTTGSGKSVCINTIILSLLYRILQINVSLFL